MGMEERADVKIGGMGGDIDLVGKLANLNLNGDAKEHSVSSSDDESEEVEPEEGVITIRQLTSGTMYNVPVTVHNQGVMAVVDTAAEVTLISEDFYKSLKDPPPIRR